MICLHARYSYIFLEVWRTLHPAMDFFVRLMAWRSPSRISSSLSLTVDFPCGLEIFFSCRSFSQSLKMYWSVFSGALTGIYHYTVYSNHPQCGIEAGDKANLALETLLVAFLSRLEELQGTSKNFFKNSSIWLWLYNSSPWKDPPCYFRR